VLLQKLEERLGEALHNLGYVEGLHILYIRSLKIIVE
jgi:hypothetical protein